MPKTINAKASLPSQEELHALLSLNPETGVLTWKKRSKMMFSESGIRSQEHAANVWNVKYAGKEAFTWEISGYRYGTIWKRKFAAHRVIWKMETGEEPDEIDHINGNRKDNRIANLRNVSRTENARNISVGSSNTSGRIGVFWNTQAGAWQARIKIGGVIRHLGTFHDFNDACDARKAAERSMGFHENHGRMAYAKGN